MKFNCLTSVEIIPSTSSNIIEKNINEFKKYSLTFIEIGPNEQVSHVFEFQRENSEKFSIIMKPGSIIITSINWHESDIIDLEFSNDATRSDLFTIKSMRISNIKVTKKTNLTEPEKEKYLQLTTKLNNLSHNSIEAINLIKKTKFYNAKKSSENRMRDFRHLINTFCDPDAEPIKEIPKNLKYIGKVPIKDEESLQINKDNYHQRKRDNKTNWHKLVFRDVVMTRFDDVWFGAINLKELELLNLNFADTSYEAWESFAYGIEKLRHLKKLVLSGNFDDIPDIVFEKLSMSLTNLLLIGLNRLSENVKRFKKLNELSLKFNIELVNIPWNDIPENLRKLSFIGTGITEIPSNIQKLCNLESLDFTENKSTPVKIAWTSLCKNIKSIKISNVENLNDFKHANFAMLEEIKIVESQEENFDVKALPKTLKKISLDNFGITPFDCDISLFPYLNEMDLSKLSLEKFPFECITRPISKVNLSNNKLEHLYSPTNWIKIEFLDLSHNKIYEILMDGWDDTEMPKRDNPWIILNLSGNSIDTLPKGFEKLPIKELNVSNNSIQTGDFKDYSILFWYHLPRNLVKLDISDNNAFTLSHQLLELSSLTEIKAMNCELVYICPRICGKLFCNKTFNLNVKYNKSFAALPFAPSKIFPYIQGLVKPTKCEKTRNSEVINSADDKYEIFWQDLHETYKDLEEKWCGYYDTNKTSIRILTDASFINTQQTKVIDLSFKPVQNLRSDSFFYCYCCAKCGNRTNNPIVEQLMTMDYDLFQEEIKNSESICHYWPEKTWKTVIKTRFCDACINQYKEESKNLNITIKRKLNNAEEVSEKKQNMQTNEADEEVQMEEDGIPLYNQTNNENISSTTALPSINSFINSKVHGNGGSSTRTKQMRTTGQALGSSDMSQGEISNSFCVSTNSMGETQLNSNMEVDSEPSRRLEEIEQNEVETIKKQLIQDISEINSLDEISKLFQSLSTKFKAAPLTINELVKNNNNQINCTADLENMQQTQQQLTNVDDSMMHAESDDRQNFQQISCQNIHSNNAYQWKAENGQAFGSEVENNYFYPPQAFLQQSTHIPALPQAFVSPSEHQTTFEQQMNSYQQPINLNYIQFQFHSNDLQQEIHHSPTIPQAIQPQYETFASQMQAAPYQNSSLNMHGFHQSLNNCNYPLQSFHNEQPFDTTQPSGNAAVQTESCDEILE